MDYFYIKTEGKRIRRRSYLIGPMKDKVIVEAIVIRTRGGDTLYWQRSMWNKTGSMIAAMTKFVADHRRHENMTFLGFKADLDNRLLSGIYLGRKKDYYLTICDLHSMVKRLADAIPDSEFVPGSDYELIKRKEPNGTYSLRAKLEMIYRHFDCPVRPVRGTLLERVNWIRDFHKFYKALQEKTLVKKVHETDSSEKPQKA